MPRYSTESFGSGNMAWVGSEHGINNARTAQVNVSAFTAGTHYPDGYIRSGQPVALVAGLLVPYASGVNEVQTINLGAATAGTITITFDGETTGAIAFNATASAVQTALDALSNVDAGDIVVTGGPLPGTITLTFGGQYAGRDVAQVTVTPTGLTGGTVTVATSTAGGSAVAGSQVLAGFVLTDQKVVGTSNFPAPLLDHGRVIVSKLPVAFTAPSGVNDKTTIVFV